jgi:hypothetical protein
MSKKLQVELGADISELLTLYTAHLPLYDDLQEARVVHRMLCDLVEGFADAVLGKNYVNAPSVIRAMTHILKVGPCHCRMGPLCGPG